MRNCVSEQLFKLITDHPKYSVFVHNLGGDNTSHHFVMRIDEVSIANVAILTENEEEDIIVQREWDMRRAFEKHACTKLTFVDDKLSYNIFKQSLNWHPSIVIWAE